MDQQNFIAPHTLKGYVAFSVPDKAEDFIVKPGETYWCVNKEVKPMNDNIVLGSPVRSDKIRISNTEKESFPFVLDLYQDDNYLSKYRTRIFEVEILGGYNYNSRGEGNASCVRVINEINPDFVKEMKVARKMNLPYVNHLYDRGINLILSGSTALYLYGVRLPRWENGGAGDLDAIAPFFIHPRDLIDRENYGLSGSDDDEYSSGNDYDYNFRVNMSGYSSYHDIKVDIRVDPAQRFKIVKYLDREYKVVPFETIIEAKARYALERKGQWKKHQADLLNMFAKTPNKIEKYVKRADLGNAVPPPDKQ